MFRGERDLTCLEKPTYIVKADGSFVRKEVVTPQEPVKLGEVIFAKPKP